MKPLEITDLRPCASAIVRSAGAYRTVAIRPIAAGEVILQVEGELVERPSRLSIQVGERSHIELPPGVGLEELLDSCHWRFLNHSCDPCAAFRGLELIALRPIAAWQEITFDYNTTEWEIAEPFACACGATSCRGELVRGYRHLDAAARARLEPHVAEHNRRLGG